MPGVHSGGQWALGRSGRGETVGKLSAWDAYYPTWEEAKIALTLIVSDRLSKARNEVDEAFALLVDIDGLKRN